MVAVRWPPRVPPRAALCSTKVDDHWVPNFGSREEPACPRGGQSRHTRRTCGPSWRHRRQYVPSLAFVRASSTDVPPRWAADSEQSMKNLSGRIRTEVVNVARRLREPVCGIPAPRAAAHEEVRSAILEHAVCGAPNGSPGWGCTRHPDLFHCRRVELHHAESAFQASPLAGRRLAPAIHERPVSDALTATAARREKRYQYGDTKQGPHGIVGHHHAS